MNRPKTIKKPQSSGKARAAEYKCANVYVSELREAVALDAHPLGGRGTVRNLPMVLGRAPLSAQLGGAKRL